MRFLAALLLLWLTGPALATPAENRVALVIGIGDYAGVRKLANPVNDASAVERALEKLGFKVTIETNRTRRRLMSALEDFAEDQKGADVALVFFAGHAVQIVATREQLAGVVTRVEQNLSQPLKVPVWLIRIGEFGKQLDPRQGLILENPLAIFQVPPDVRMGELRGDAEKKVHGDKHSNGDDVARPEIERREG